MTSGDLRGVYRRHFSNARRERAFLSAVGFTTAFTVARGITHAIRAGVGPFANITAGGRHIHHSTFGILGLLGVGYLWTYQIGIGTGAPPRWGSRVSATGYGVASALTLDEFAAAWPPARLPGSLNRAAAASSGWLDLRDGESRDR
jgi:hypothetical protein